MVIGVFVYLEFMIYQHNSIIRIPFSFLSFLSSIPSITLLFLDLAIVPSLLYLSSVDEQG
jgi:hypothetical protein